jgi:5'-nucleotidase / UDP-sugar diphosphatase
MKILRFLTALAILTNFACSTTTAIKSTYGVADDKVEWIFLQTNDVYEIAPLSGGKIGGLARIATLRKELLKENPNTFTVMAGDFLSPSLIGTMKFEGQGIKGRQMVEVMNAVGYDFVCLGNHEFDLDFPDLQKRIDESNFTWISSNAFHQVGEGIEPFNRSKDPDNTGFPEYKILEVSDGPSGENAKIGLWSVVIDANKKDFIHYSDVAERSNSLIEDVLKKDANVIVGLTHVMIDQDKDIAAKNPSVSLIMGGHEHNNMIFDIGKTRITKADANAVTKQVKINSKLITIDSKIVEDPEVAVLVKKWTDIANASFRKAGFDPDDVVTTLAEPLDGRSVTIRGQQNNLGAVITKAMSVTAKNPLDCAIFNSGSVRIDDMIEGTITQGDITRILPYGGKIYELDIKGSELKKVLTVGLLNKGRGGYLQWNNISYSEVSKSFTVKNNLLDENKTYHIVVNDFLLSGNETNLDFFTETNPNISNLQTLNPADATDLRNDIRKALIAYLKNKK